MVIDLKFLKVVIGPELLWLWNHKFHFKRYYKRYLPWAAQQCDWCNDYITVIPMHHHHDGSGPPDFYVALCRTCHEERGWGWHATGKTEREALENWIHTGGDEFAEPGLEYRAAPPPWTKGFRDRLSKLRNYVQERLTTGGLGEVAIPL